MKKKRADLKDDGRQMLIRVSGGTDKYHDGRTPADGAPDETVWHVGHWTNIATGERITNPTLLAQLNAAHGEVDS